MLSMRTDCRTGAVHALFHVWYDNHIAPNYYYYKHSVCYSYYETT